MYQVYLITNKLDGKQYVGITKRGYELRYQEHILEARFDHDNYALHNALGKYGEENFQVEVIEENIPESDIDSKEIYYIDKFKTFYLDGGYNLTRGGGGVKGYHHTSETRKKISESHKGVKRPPEVGAKISASQKGREYKKEWREKLSQVRMGRFTKEDNPFYGKHHNEKTKTRISDANTKHSVIQLEPHSDIPIREFKNVQEAGRWVVEQGLTTAQPGTCAGMIYSVCVSDDYTKHTGYGYSWKFGEGPSTKSRVENELPLEAQNTAEGKVNNLGDDIVSTS